MVEHNPDGRRKINNTPQDLPQSSAALGIPHTSTEQIGGSRGLPKILARESDLEGKVRELLPNHSSRPSVIAKLLGLERSEIDEILKWIKKKDTVIVTGGATSEKVIEIDGIRIVGAAPKQKDARKHRPQKGVVPPEEILKAIKEHEDTNKIQPEKADPQDEITKTIVEKYFKDMEIIASVREQGENFDRTRIRPETLARRTAIRALRHLPHTKLTRILGISKSILSKDLQWLNEERTLKSAQGSGHTMPKDILGKPESVTATKETDSSSKPPTLERGAPVVTSHIGPNGTIASFILFAKSYLEDPSNTTSARPFQTDAVSQPDIDVPAELIKDDIDWAGESEPHRKEKTL
jgi:hypothetical protein